MAWSGSARPLVSSARRSGRIAALVCASAVVLGAIAGPAAAIPAPWKRCSTVNKLYPHGVGKLGARDHVAAGAEHVTNFKRSTRIYNKAMSFNRGLGRDHDGIACEKS